MVFMADDPPIWQPLRCGSNHVTARATPPDASYGGRAAKLRDFSAETRIFTTAWPLPLLCRMFARHDQFADREPQEPQRLSRLNLMLSDSGWREESAVNQLPRLLSPMGIESYRVESAEEAAELIRSVPIHIAVVDLAIPLHRQSPRPLASGSRVLQLLRRLDQPPPTMVLRPPYPAARDGARTLSDALREGAFAVLDRPVQLETILEVMRRVLHRHYAGFWPQT
jgi:CheY-like chemotaxis protein